MFRSSIILLSLLAQAAGPFSGEFVQPRPAPGTAAPPRSGHSLVYSSQLGQVLMFGGSEAADPYPASLWSWDGGTWTRLAADGPPGRDDAILVNDPGRNRVVLYGGRRRTPNGLVLLTDTWEWDGARWELRDTVGPGARIHAAAAYDGNRSRVVVYGGGSMGDDVFRDTWEWDGERWSRRPGEGPENRIVNGLTFDARSRRLLLLTVTPDSTGCTMPSEVWSSDGGPWRIAESENSGPAFSPRAPETSAGDTGLLLFEGWPCPPRAARSWIWNGQRWDQFRGPGPAARRGTALAYDERRHRVVLFGGEDEQRTYGDTWEWDGARWFRVTGQ